MDASIWALIAGYLTAMFVILYLAWVIQKNKSWARDDYVTRLFSSIQLKYLRRVVLLNTVFWIGFMTALWGSFEWACELTEAGIIDNPVWSGTFGFPVPHHYLIGFGLVAFGWALIMFPWLWLREKIEAWLNRHTGK